MPPWWSWNKAHLERDELTQSGMLQDISCKPFVSFGLPGKNVMRDPKRGQSFVSLHCRVMWSPLYSKSIKLLMSKKKLRTKFYFTTLWYQKILQLFLKIKLHQVCSIPGFLFYGTILRCYWEHVGECIWECIAEATSFLHWWQMSGLVHWPAQMTHMYHHTLTGPSRLLYLRAQLIHFVANAFPWHVVPTLLSFHHPHSVCF
jgi:hypothetical protein